MPKQEEIHLAARLVHHEIVDREAMQDCLKACSDGPEGPGLQQLLLDRGILTREEVEAYSGVSLEKLQPIPNYRIKSEIGEGGMARIYRAVYTPIDREIALKVLHPELGRQERARMRFFREAGILRHLDHPSIVKVFEDGHCGPWHYYAMEYVPGISLQDRLEKEGPLTEFQAYKVIRQIADAMAVMVSRGVLHRDIKPGNILITETFDARIIDLGLAKLVAGMRDDGADGMTVGTVEYISPEQARGAEVDIRSDIYSLGVTLYHSVVGEVPFSGEDQIEIMAKQILSSLKSPRMQKLSPYTRYLIEKMMAKDVSHRYQSPAGIVEDIDAHLGDVSTVIEVDMKKGGGPAEKGRKGEAPRSAASTRRKEAPTRTRPGARGRGRQDVRRRKRR